ncbi:MAG: gliding motility-associated C-terminal domain-containing protein [Spirosomataceae bacterium]
MCTRRVLLLWLLAGTAALNGRAAHIFGGDFSMIALPVQGQYQLVLNIYADANTLQSGNNDPDVDVYIFRKKDHVRMAEFKLLQKTNTPIIYQNEACAGSQGLKTVELKYSRDIVLDPALYNDPGGYYIVWERCCRTDGVDNLQRQVLGVGMVFMLEFPALMANSKFFKNSSPDFGIPNGDYICINKPFKMSMKATDSDGDELRYSLVTPLQGHTTNVDNNSVKGTGQSYSSYPSIIWETGFGLTNIIPGNPALAVDSKTGQLTVTANRLGLFVFTVLVEEYRNGLKIGSVRRDFQLKVIDCSGTPPPVPTLFAGTNITQPANIVEMCEGSSVNLGFSNLPDISYQWKKDGINIPDQKANTLKVTQLGDYQVSASFAKKCALDTISQLVKVIAGKGPNARLTPSDSVKICTGETVTLEATAGTGFNYEWFKNGTSLPNETKNTLPTKQLGTYVVSVSDPVHLCPTRDTVIVAAGVSPTKPPLNASKNILCVRDSVKLETELQAGSTIEWLRSNQVIAKDQKTIYPKQEGYYQVKVSNGRCSALSDSVRLTLATSNSIVFDSLQSVCYNDSLRVVLKATPANGKFVGEGVDNNFVNVKNAGAGRHAIRYEVSVGGGCIVEKTRYLEVKASPIVSAPASVTQLRDEESFLNARADNSAGYTYRWTPPLGITDPTALQTAVTAPQTTTYQLTVTAPNGCVSTVSIRVLVMDLLFIPDVFSPNGDGLNDRWEIRNIEHFPEAEVFVYNRWGEVVFHQDKGYQNPWDGSYLGNRVAPGEYTYKIVPNTDGGLAVQRGKVWVIR